MKQDITLIGNCDGVAFITTERKYNRLW
ncbi:protein of unknown function [Trichlorobacter ammonificans]|uniref:Uncharacterized protein n=1 Tax=Trichlorobacter ammonificans TaxID=2916410 RepID=A0ABM9DAT7_9BACT|nr:protein of unknown function [Trichlorobacter ammonificans]